MNDAAHRDKTRVELPFWSTGPGLALLVAVSGLYVSSLALNWDAAIYLVGARALSEGRTLYVSFPDYGFPANMWLASLSLWLANGMHVPPAFVHSAVLFALTSAATCCSVRLLDALLVPGSLARAFAAPVSFTVFIFSTGFDAGQRDVLFALATAPLVLVSLGRGVGRPPSDLTALAAAAFAVAGASLKPHFILALALLGVCDGVARRGPSRRWLAEWLAMGGALALYLVVVHLGYPTYFTEVLPTATHSYAGYGASMAALLRNYAWTGMFGVLAATALAIVLWERRRAGLPVPWHLAAAWLMVAFVLSFLYFSQRQGFGYHRRAAAFLYLMTFVLSVLSLADSLPSRARWIAGATIALSLVGLAGWRFATPTIPLRDALGDPFTTLLRSLPAKTPVLALDTGVSPVSPLISYADVRWTGQHGSLVELRAIVSDRDRSSSAQPRDPVLVHLEGDVRARMLASFAPFSPDVVFVNVAASPDLRWFESYERPFTILGFYGEDPAFVGAMSRYARAGSIRSLGQYRYDVYIRRGAPLGPLGGLDP